MTHQFKLFYRSPPIDKWFHAAAVWDRDANEAYLFLDGQKVGTQAVPSNMFFQNNNQLFYDIGQKRDARHTLKGYLRDLIVVRRALTGEEINKIAGELTLLQ